MKRLGLSADDLLKYGSAEYASASSESMMEVINDMNLITDPDLEATLTGYQHAAILKAVALMIEVNNQALLEQLKQLGLVNDPD